MMVPKVTIKMRWEIKLPGSFYREHWCSLEAGLLLLLLLARLARSSSEISSIFHSD